MSDDLAIEIERLSQLPAAVFALEQYATWLRRLTARVGPFTERPPTKDAIGYRLRDALLERSEYSLRLSARANTAENGQVFCGCFLTLFSGGSYLQMTAAFNGARLRWKFKHAWPYGLRLFFRHYGAVVPRQDPAGEWILPGGSHETQAHVQAFVDAAFPRPGASAPQQPAYVLHKWCHDLLIEAEILGIIRTKP